MDKLVRNSLTIGTGIILLGGLVFGLFVLNTDMVQARTLAQQSVPSTCIILGIHPNKGLPNGDLLDKLESFQSKKNANITIYSATLVNLLDSTFSELEKTWNRGSVPNLTLEFGSENPDNTTIETRILQGELDSYFGQFALRLQKFIKGTDNQLGTRDDRRLYLRPGHEPNGNWYGWSGNPEAYIYAWRRAYNIINPGLSKSQLQWIWSVNNVDVGGISAESYYPGDDYVDWLGIDGYNWGKSFDWADWNSPNSVFDNMLGRLKVLSPSKPISINEVSSTTNLNGVAGKNLWISSMFEYALQNNIKMISWFNEDKETDWAVFGGGSGDITSQDQKAYSSYGQAVKDPRIVGADTGNPRVLSDSQFDGSGTCQTTLALKINLEGAWFR